MNEEIERRLERYFLITEKALEKARDAPENLDAENARYIFLDMIKRYIDDAKHFKEKGELLNAFAAINYAHGWLDAGARIGLWEVNDSELFTVDEK